MVVLKFNYNCSWVYLVVCFVILVLFKKLCKVNEIWLYGMGVWFVKMLNVFFLMCYWMLIIILGYLIWLIYKYLVIVWLFNILKVEENGNIKKKYFELV